MDLINKYLDKFRNIKDPKDNKCIILNILGKSGVILDIKQVEIRKNNIYLSNINPIIKNQVFVNKIKIIEDINKEIPNLNIENIF